MILPLFFLLPVFNKGIKLKKMISAGFWFTSGVLIAVPALLLTPFNSMFLKTYIKSTFKNTDHYDDSNVNIIDWMEKGFSPNYSGHISIASILTLIFIFIIANGIWNFYKTKKIENYLIIASIGFCLLIPVLILTKRIWPHYLWTGFIFFMLSIFIYFQNINVKLTLIKNLNIGIGIFVLIITSFSISKQLKLIELEANQSLIKKNSIDAYNYIERNNNNFICVQDISVFYPYDDFLNNNRYHPFSSPNPYTVNLKKYKWVGFINPEIIKKVKANYILTYLRNFETKNDNIISPKDSIIKIDNEKMKNILKKNVFLDTIIGKIRVYKIINGKNL